MSMSLQSRQPDLPYKTVIPHIFLAQIYFLYGKWSKHLPHNGWMVRSLGIFSLKYEAFSVHQYTNTTLYQTSNVRACTDYPKPTLSQLIQF